MSADSFARLKDDLRMEPEIRHLLQSVALAERSHFFILETDAPLQAKAAYEILAEVVPAIREEPMRFHRHAPRGLQEHFSPADKFHQLIIQVLTPLYYWNSDKETEDGRACVFILDGSAGQKKDATAWIMFFQRLNEVRNVLMDNLPGPLILFIPTFFELEFCYNAPDFWSIRSAIVHARAMPPPPPADQKRPPTHPPSLEEPDSSEIKRLDALIKEAQQHLASNPKDFTAARALVIVLTRRGDYELEYGRLEVALHDYSKSHEVMRKLLAFDPERPSYHYDAGVSCYKLAMLFEKKEVIGEASDYMRKAYKEFKPLSEHYPDVTDWKRAAEMCADEIVRLST